MEGRETSSGTWASDRIGSHSPGEVGSGPAPPFRVRGGLAPSRKLHNVSTASFEPGNFLGGRRAIFRRLPGRDRGPRKGRADRDGDGQRVVHPLDGEHEPDPFQRGLHAPDVSRGTVPRAAGRERLPDDRDRGGPARRRDEPERLPGRARERPVFPPGLPRGYDLRGSPAYGCSGVPESPGLRARPDPDAGPQRTTGGCRRGPPDIHGPEKGGDLEWTSRRMTPSGCS